jgi:non-ribosomal peptide synthetase component E (peptide arylation enzyme)
VGQFRVAKSTHDLLKTQFPKSQEHTTAAFCSEGFWEGDLVHTTRKGRKIVVASRQAMLREGGRPIAILEVNRVIRVSKEMHKAQQT